MPDVRIFVSGREPFGVPTGFGHAFGSNIFSYIPCLVVTHPRWVLQSSSVESSPFVGIFYIAGVLQSISSAFYHVLSMLVHLNG
jgi:hypothetical protein